MSSPGDGSAVRTLLDNRVLGRFVTSYFAGVLAEWAIFVAALVYAFERGGSAIAGLASVVMLAPNVLCAPLAGAAAERWRPNRVRLGAYGAEAVAYSAAAVAAAAGAPALVVVLCCAVGVGALTFVRPAAAVLVPAIVRSSRELTRANLFVGFCESASVLAGPLMAAVLLSVAGPALAIAGCAAACAVSVVAGLPDLRTDPPPISAPADEHGGVLAGMHRSLTAMRARPGTGGVLFVAGSQYVLVGALDLLLVILAVDVLELGDAGPGWLSTALGAGALVSAIGGSMLVARVRLAPIIAGALAAVAVAVSTLGMAATVVMAFALLPVLGFSRSLLDVTSRMLLQRSAPPSELAGAFALIELLGGIGMLAGSLLAQFVVAVSGVEAALVTIGVFFAVTLAGTWRDLRVADQGADVPIVAVSLLRRHPVFAPLPPVALEAAARGTVEVAVPAGCVVVAEGDEGDRFYAVADGRFEVVMGGELVRTVTRGGGFGEVALLADVPRTATVRAVTDGLLLGLDRVPFLVAVTGSDSSQMAAWGAIRAMRFDREVPDRGPAQP